VKVQFGSFEPEENGGSASLEEGVFRPANVNEHGEILYRVKVNLDSCMLYACPIGDRSR